MQSNKGITSESITPGSIAEEAGFRPGDIVCDVNSSPMRDVIDFMFHKDDDRLNVGFHRDGARKQINISSRVDPASGRLVVHLLPGLID